MRHPVSLRVLPFVLLTILLSACGGGGGAPVTPMSPAAAPVSPGGNAAAGEFTIVVLPDTQYYSQESNGASLAMFTAQTNWIAANRSAMNIRAVVGVGDIVQCGGSEAEWAKADGAYKALDGAGIPYLPTIGNHDYDGNCGDMGAGRSAGNYNRWFGPARLAGHSWYGGSSFPAGSHENFFIRFDAGDRKFLALALEFYPRDAALSWAQSVIDANPDREVIMVTHACVNTNGQFIGLLEPKGPLAYQLLDGNDGQGIWNKFVRRNSRIVALVNGHLHGTGRMVLNNDAGRPVPMMLSNFQAEANGGNGYLRVLKFRPSAGVIEVTTFSPFLNQSRTDDANQFSVPYR